MLSSCFGSDITPKMSGAKDNKAQAKAMKVQNSADALAALPFASDSILLLDEAATRQATP